MKTNKVCDVKTIRDLQRKLELASAILGADAPVVMSKDEEGNAYGDILMFTSISAKELYEYGNYYPADEENCAVKKEDGEKKVLIIYPAL